MSLILFIVKLLEKIGVSVLVKKISDSINRVDFKEFGLFPRQRYRLKLANILKKMPFIYKEMDAEVLVDFQEILVGSLELDIERVNISLKDYIYQLILKWDTNSNSYSLLSQARQFKDHRKILIVGSPGIGKSTLMRHVTLCAIKGKKTDYLNTTKLIPVFVPLNAISNSDASPILDHIFSEIDYFKRKRGKVRFLRLVKSRKLLLILDGYDEISYSESKRNFARSEISILLTGTLSSADLQLSAVKHKYYEIYEGLKSCRVWLSTRGEFYDRHPLRSFDAGKFIGLKDADTSFHAAGLNGLGGKRENYVKKIFDRQRERGAIYIDLNEEIFIKDLDNSQDSELIEMSSVPLFLTIMCFVYIKHLENNKEILRDWNMSIEMLVTFCIKALLFELDEAKAKEMPKKLMLAFYERRNGRVEEKEHFLSYFAYTLLMGNMPAFTSEHIYAKEIEYFTEKSKSEFGNDVLQEIRNPNSSHTNFHQQLIQSEIFKVVPIVASKKVYDFPHRRFREVLAIKYVRDQVGVDVLLEDILNPNKSEFITLYFRTVERDRYRILSKLLNFFETEQSIYANNLFVSCIKQTKFTMHELIRDKIKLWILENKRVKISKTILSICDFDANFVSWLLENVLSNVGYKNKLNSVSIALAVLEKENDRALYEILKSQLHSKSHLEYSFYDMLITKHFIRYCCDSWQINIASGDLIRDKLFGLNLSTISRILFQLLAYDDNRDIAFIIKEIDEFIRLEKSLLNRIALIAIVEKIKPNFFQNLEFFNWEWRHLKLFLRVYSLITEPPFDNLENSEVFLSISKRVGLSQFSNLMRFQRARTFMDFNNKLCETLGTLDAAQVLALQKIKKEIVEKSIDLLDGVTIDR